ncbi:MAG: bacillithiol biosynthesis deacetylase BshB1 [Bacteroidia bacterium]|nr:bacillithiol biosynthesis deacetylase BshB1 [Bacteroidia bacterium]MCZ2247921.1 bacillithiol biosynthesis deacetylase BshB1 [Bacteroidia bacterium]
MKIDILAIAAHPDDAELGCAGTLIKHQQQGAKIGIVDLTAGELGTRGSAELRAIESKKSSEILKLSCRENLGFEDGFFKNDKEHLLPLIHKIRKYKPEIVLANSLNDRHPDHGRASKLIADACFYAGLVKIETFESGQKQDAWRPKSLYHYIQYYYLKPDFLIDISEQMETKMEAVMAYSSQFYNPNSAEPETPISSMAFMNSLKERASDLGRMIGVKYAEGFNTSRLTGVNSLFNLI